MKKGSLVGILLRSIVAFIRVMRSVIFIFSLVGKRLPGGDPTTPMLVAEAPGLKLVVSMTSVVPSQWPRETPSHCFSLEDGAAGPLIGTMRASWIISMLRIT